MKSWRIILGVAVGILAACAVAFLIADGPRAAFWPGLYAIAGGVVLYILVKHPMPPTRWSKQRIMLSAAVLVPTTAAMVAALIWVIVVVPDWPARVLAAIGLVVVPALLLWLVRTARRDDRAALQDG